MAMKNYYDELKLNPSASLSDLQSELIRQENLWRKREINSPETATAKLALINEAKKIFSSLASKAAYDRELDNTHRKPVSVDPNTRRYQQWKKWYDQARLYLADSQYDLAKTAIDKALQYTDPDNEDALFYDLASVIYRECGDYDSAISFANKAIVNDNSKSGLYITKGVIYTEIIDKGKIQPSERITLMQTERKIFLEGLSKTNLDDNRINKGILLGLLGASWYREMRLRGIDNYIENTDSLEEQNCHNYAVEAYKLGDSWGNGERVLRGLKKLDDMRQAARVQQEQNTENERKRVKRAKREAEIEKIRQYRRYYFYLASFAYILLIGTTIISLSIVVRYMSFWDWIKEVGFVEAIGIIGFLSFYHTESKKANVQRSSNILLLGYTLYILIYSFAYARNNGNFFMFVVILVLLSIFSVIAERTLCKFLGSAVTSMLEGFAGIGVKEKNKQNHVGENSTYPASNKNIVSSKNNGVSDPNMEEADEINEWKIEESGEYKTDMIKFDTKKTPNEVLAIIRNDKSKKERLDEVPYGSVYPSLAVLLYGRASFADVFKHAGAGKSEWAFKLYVYDLGSKRRVFMVALGESQLRAKISNGYLSASLAYVNMRHSKGHRDKIAQMIKA